MPVDFFITHAGPAIYRTNTLHVPSHATVAFDRIRLGISYWNRTSDHYERPLNPGPDDWTIYAIVFAVKPKYHRDSSSCPWDTSYPQCLDYDALVDHGVGIRLPENHHDKDDPPSPENYAFCCSADLVKRGLCKQNRHATTNHDSNDTSSYEPVLVNKDIFDGKIQQWTIPVGHSSVPLHQLAESMTIPVDDKEGRRALRYFVVIATCYDMDDDDTFDRQKTHSYTWVALFV